MNEIAQLSLLRDTASALTEQPFNRGPLGQEGDAMTTTTAKPHSTPVGSKGRKNGARWLARQLAVLPLPEAVALIEKYNRPADRRHMTTR